MQPLDARPKMKEGLARRTIAGEAVVVTPVDSKVHELDLVATFVFERCDGVRTGRELARAVVAEFEVDPATAERDVARLVETFAERGLVELV